MRNSHLAVSACRHCQHYATEGRRGGHCKQLGAPVQGAWKACCLAIPPFAPTWETATGINEDAAPSWLPEMPSIPGVAATSCDSMAIEEATYPVRASVAWKSTASNQTVLI